jgi:hypothetical protein
MMKFVERVNGMSEKKRALGLKRVSNPSIYPKSTPQTPSTPSSETSKT